MSGYIAKNLPKEYYQRPIDVFARRTHFIDHVAPIWAALENKGEFYVPEYLLEYTLFKGIAPTPLKPLSSNPLDVRPPGKNILLVAGYDDLENGVYAHQDRPLIFMEHGVGITFGKHPSYAGGLGMRKRVHLFLAPNEFIFKKTAKVFPEASQAVIGTPKLDMIPKMPTHHDDPTVVISFHWDGKAVEPEAGNAFNYYRNVIRDIAKEYKLVGHAHPRIQKYIESMYNELGIPFWPNFIDVLYKGDIYINDCSSTAYEFAVTDKPTILLNAPQFRKNVNFGIRFWDYTDFAPMVDKPEDLLPTLRLTVEYPNTLHKEREKMIEELYPFKGHSAQRAANAIKMFLKIRSEGNNQRFEFH